MGLLVARILPPIAVAVVIVSLDYVRHVYWHLLDTWLVFLLAVVGAGVGAYILSELLMRVFTRRYSTSVKVAARIAGLPSALERIGDSAQPQRRAMVKQELLREVANLAGAEGAAFFAAEAGRNLASLDAAYGIPEKSLPQSVPWDASDSGGGQTPNPDKAITVLQPALWRAGFFRTDVLPLRSGGQAVGYLVLTGSRKLRDWLQWQEARELVNSLVGGVLRNLQLTSEGQVIATLRERDRIARELHDSLAQTLTYIQMETRNGSGAPHSNVRDVAGNRLEAIAEAARDGLRDIRTAILDLRGGKKVDGQDILGLLEQYIQRFAKDTGLSVEIVVEPDAATAFPSFVEIQLLRVVQEALTNVRKHAAEARHVKITFCSEPDVACICVKDDGVGFEPARVLQGGHGFGLVSMRERLQDLGGELLIESGPGLGTRIKARVPV